MFMTNQAFVYYNRDKLFVDVMTFGDWLRQQIKESGFSNAEVARRAGVSPTYIGNLVRDFSPNTKDGKGRPSEEVVADIAKAFGANTDDARLAAGYAPLEDASARGLHRGYDKLSPRLRRVADKQIDAIIESLAAIDDDDFDYIDDEKK